MLRIEGEARDVDEDVDEGVDVGKEMKVPLVLAKISTLTAPIASFLIHLVQLLLHLGPLTSPCPLIQNLHKFLMCSVIIMIPPVSQSLLHFLAVVVVVEGKSQHVIVQTVRVMGTMEFFVICAKAMSQKV